jgi:hypothetical protein
MLIRFEVPDSQKFQLNIGVLKELFQKYGYKEGKRIRPQWIENLMHEIDPYKFFLEWDIQDITLQFAADLKKFINSCPTTIPEITLVFPNGTKFIINKSERAVQLYERLKEEI